MKEEKIFFSNNSTFLFFWGKKKKNLFKYSFYLQSKLHSPRDYAVWKTDLYIHVENTFLIMNASIQALFHSIADGSYFTFFIDFDHSHEMIFISLFFFKKKYCIWENPRFWNQSSFKHKLMRSFSCIKYMFFIFVGTVLPYYVMDVKCISWVSVPIT